MSRARTVLVLGGSGRLGSAVVPAFEAAGWEVAAPPSSRLDITDRALVLGAAGELRPDAIVNLAGFIDAEGCEADPDRAFRVNALAVRHLAEAARATSAHLCHLSTDYVFDGAKADAYDEWDATAPLSVYGHSKVAGELEAGPEATTIRTAWLSGRQGRSAVRTVLALAADPDRDLAYVDDQRGSPSLVTDVAEAVVQLTAERRRGLFHVTNQGAATRYELARAVLVAAGHDPDRVRPITTAELVPARSAARPANSVLDNRSLRAQGLPLLPDWRDSIPRLVRELIA